MSRNRAQGCFAEGARQGAAGWMADNRLQHAAWPFDPAGLRQPVVFCHATADSAAPYADVQRVAATLPQATVITVEGGGHIITVHRVGEMVAAIVEAVPVWAGA